MAAAAGSAEGGAAGAATICGRFCTAPRDDPGTGPLERVMLSRVLSNKLSIEALSHNRIECHSCGPQPWLQNPTCPGTINRQHSFISTRVIKATLVSLGRKAKKIRPANAKRRRVETMLSRLPRAHIVELAPLMVPPTACYEGARTAYYEQLQKRQRSFTYADVAALMRAGCIERPVIKAAQCCHERSYASTDAQAVHAVRAYFGGGRLGMDHPAAPRLLRAIDAVRRKFGVSEDVWQLVLARLFVL